LQIKPNEKISSLLLFHIFNPMKKICLLVFCTILVLNNVTAQVGYAPEVGVNFSSMHFTPPFYYQQVSVKGLVGPRIGGIIDLDMGKHIYIQPGLFFSSKGAKRNLSYNYNDTAQSVNETLRLDYIELPINVLFKTGVQGDNRFFFGLGVDFAQLVGGKDNVHDLIDTGTGQNFAINSNGNPNNAVASFDIGLNFTLGYELRSGAYIRAFYTMGVRDLSLDSDEGEVDKNFAGGVSIGYFFGKNRHQKRVVEPIEEGN
jgi:hypothetical protein